MTECDISTLRLQSFSRRNLMPLYPNAANFSSFNQRQECKSWNWRTQEVEFQNYAQATGGGFPAGGIEGPFLLPAGTRLWRMDDKPAVLAPDDFVSPWWCLRDEHPLSPHFRKGRGLENTMLESIRLNIDFEVYARMCSCVKIHWNGMDKLQLAYVKRPVMALWGQFEPMALVDFPELPNPQATPQARPRAFREPGRGRALGFAGDETDRTAALADVDKAVARARKKTRRLVIINKFKRANMEHLLRTGAELEERERLNKPENMLGSDAEGRPIKSYQLFIPGLTGSLVHYTSSHLSSSVVFAHFRDIDRLTGGHLTYDDHFHLNQGGGNQAIEITYEFTEFTRGFGPEGEGTTSV